MFVCRLFAGRLLLADLRACGVGHGAGSPEEALPRMRRAEARSWQIGGCEPIAKSLQVRSNSGDPNLAKRARNLLPKQSCRPALGDEPAERSEPPRSSLPA